MAEGGKFRMSQVQSSVLDVDLDGQAFRYSRAGDVLTVEAWLEGDIVEQLRVSKIGNGYRVTVRDETGKSVTYTGGTRGDMVFGTLRTDGGTYDVEAPADSFARELVQQLEKMELPQLPRITPFLRLAQADAQFRAEVGGDPSGVQPPGISLDCALHCAQAAFPTGIWQIGFLGYCLGCTTA